MDGLVRKDVDLLRDFHLPWLGTITKTCLLHKNIISTSMPAEKKEIKQKWNNNCLNMYAKCSCGTKRHAARSTLIIFLDGFA